MKGTFSPSRCMFVALFFAVMCMLGSQPGMSAQEQTSTQMGAGRLATVEPSIRRVTFVLEGEVELFEMFLSESGQITHQEQPVTLAELVLHVGRRVTVHYRQEGERRLVERLIVEGE